MRYVRGKLPRVFGSEQDDGMCSLHASVADFAHSGLLQNYSSLADSRPRPVGTVTVARMCIVYM